MPVVAGASPSRPQPVIALWIRGLPGRLSAGTGFDLLQQGLEVVRVAAHPGQELGIVQAVADAAIELCQLQIIDVDEGVGITPLVGQRPLAQHLLSAQLRDAEARKQRKQLGQQLPAVVSAVDAGRQTTDQ